MATKTSTKNKSTLAGTSVADVLTVKHDQVTVNAGGGNDTIKVTSGNSSKVSGGTGADTITVSAGKSHVIHGDAGNDTITVGTGAGAGIKVYGDAGNDVIKAANSYGVVFYGGDGNDTLTGGKGADKLYGDAGTDKLYGGAGNDTLSGGAGDDTLNGQAGTDTLTGGAGKDTFVYANGGGSDKITDYAAGYDTLQISGGSISKTALANSSKDLVFTVGSGKVTLSNAAAKTISLKDSRGSYTVSKTGITLGSAFTGTMDTANYLATVTTVNGKNTTKAMTVKGNAKANAIHGGSGANTLYGYAGNDKLYGYAGNDTLSGGDGDDTLYGGAGTDTLTGGAGKDTFVYANGEGSDTIKDYAAGQDKLYISSGSISKTQLLNGDKDVKFTIGSGSVTVQNVAGNAISLVDSRGSYTVSGTTITLGADFTGTMDAGAYLGSVRNIIGTAATNAFDIKGNFLGNTIRGNGKANKLYGYGGNDTLYGNAGDDFLYGGDGSDTLNGGDGNDTLDGGLGTNKLYGNAGNDIFNITGGKDTITGGEGRDTFNHSSGTATIKDYEAGELLAVANGITGVTVDGENITLTTGTGSVTLENGKGVLAQLTEAGTVKNFSIFEENASGGALNALNFDGSDSDDIMTLTSSSGYIYAFGKGGNDKLFGNSADGFANRLYGDDGDDELYSGSGTSTNYLYGGDGKDSIFIDGGGGSDYDYNNQISGDDGDDTIYIRGGSSLVYGGKNPNNYLDPSGGYTSNKNTFIHSAGHAAIMDFQATDTLILENAVTGVKIQENRGAVYNSDTHDYTYITTEYISLLTGTEDNVTFYDPIGKLTSFTENGKAVQLHNITRDDTELTVVMTEDLADRPLEVESIYSDNIIIDASAADSGAVVTASALLYDQNLTVTGGAGSDTINVSGEQLGQSFTVTGGDGDDVITVDAVANSTVHGGNGNDTLTGGSGNDKIYGEAGDDNLYTGAGNNGVFGGYGSDVIYVGEGNNTLAGGECVSYIPATGMTPAMIDIWEDNVRDEYVFSSGSTGNNVIHKFETDYDLIRLTDSITVRQLTPSSANSDVTLTLSNGGTITLARFGTEDLIHLYGDKGDGTVGRYALKPSVQ